MKRKVTAIILIGIMLHSAYACGNIVPENADNDEINKPVREESSESGTFQDKEVSEETKETLSNSEIKQAGRC